jgi:glutathione S-transferase
MLRPLCFAKWDRYFTFRDSNGLASGNLDQVRFLVRLTLWESRRFKSGGNRFSVHPSVAHMWRPERNATDAAVYPQIQDMGRKTFDGYLEQIDRKLTGRQRFSDRYSVVDPYLLVFYSWGLRRGFPMQELKNFSAFKERMLQRPAVQQILAKEKINF